MPAVSAQTPAMQQFFRFKADHPDALLFFRMGDFYELFFEDAELAARALEIALTSRSKDKDGTPIPMCGVPHHSAQAYIGRLVGQGFKVAICEQVEDPRLAKGVVRREVVRVVTPGVPLDDAHLEAGENAFVVALFPTPGSVGAAWLDATTGDFSISQWDGPGRWERLRDEFGSERPREILVPAGAPLAPWLEDPNQPETSIPCSRLDPEEFDTARAHQELLGHFEVLTLAAFGCETLQNAVAAAGAALRYVRESQKRPLSHVTSLKTRHPGDVMVLDALTRRNLELVENLADGSRRGTLLDVLDETRTPMGSRLLREWLLRPLAHKEPILDRLDAVEELAYGIVERQRYREALDPVQDLDRILGRVTLGTASPRDLMALARSLRALPSGIAALEACAAPLIRCELKALQPPLDLADEIERVLVPDPPLLLKEGGVVREGVDSELDELREIAQGGKATIAGIEERERQRTGIQSLKVRFNRVFGYYIEITRDNLGLVPADYVRKQTIAGGERFVTPELKEYEDKVLRAEERSLLREAELFETLRERVAADARRVQQTSRACAVLDVLAALAEVAGRYNYVKPRLLEDGGFLYLEGRHPIMERVLDEPFIANDLALGAEAFPRFMILTGPNMGGKSTFLRQTALIAVLAQMGSFVPTREARLAIVDRIFTRVGANDQILRGQSTFMVEMQETAHILRHASERSLVLLDEIGRGTATFDGLSIAWAVAEHMARETRAFTLFATHYHELVDLAADLPSVGNLHVSAKEWKESVVFLRKIEPGGSDRSFGIQVARLAGLPAPVLQRAREILRNLEQTEFDREGRPRLAHAGDAPSQPGHQLALFAGGKQEAVVAELLSLKLDTTTPLDALRILAELQLRLREP